jgi:anti-sigma regulatory factor (Ser/Thr protein kinase)
VTELLVHEGLLYHNSVEYVAGTVPFVEAGLSAGEPVLVAVPRPRRELIADELGAGAGSVRFLDMVDSGSNPNRIIPQMLRGFVDEFRNQPVRVVGEQIWAERSPEEIPGCVRHEALINVVLAEAPLTILCPYDAGALHPGVLHYAQRTHPIMMCGGVRHEQSGYTNPYDVVALLNQPLPEPAVPVTELAFDAANLSSVRGWVGDMARRIGLPIERVVDLEWATNEIVTGAVSHSAGYGVLRLWQEPGRIVCEVRGQSDMREWMSGVGRVMPGRHPFGRCAEEEERKRGLPLANKLCDLVQTYTEPNSTTTRLHLRY